MDTRIFDEREQAETALAGEIATLVRRSDAAGRAAVLGLATGRTPVGVYAELIRLHRDQGLDFSRVVMFNLDELEDPRPAARGTFRTFLYEHFLDHVNVRSENLHLLPHDTSARSAPARCAEFEGAIRATGGIELVILGVGLNGHIGFNEPGSPRASRTRRVELHATTRRSYAESGVGRAPTHALTMGIATILEARRMRVLAFGAHKAAIVGEVLHAEPGSQVPASYLHEHADAQLMLDRSAAATACA